LLRRVVLGVYPEAFSVSLFLRCRMHEVLALKTFGMVRRHSGSRSGCLSLSVYLAFRNARFESWIGQLLSRVTCFVVFVSVSEYISWLRGLAIKSLDWFGGEKRNKNYKAIKIVQFLFKAISVNLNTFVESFKKFLKTVSKGLQRNSDQFALHTFLHVFSVLKPLSFEGSFTLGKRKCNQENWDCLHKSGCVDLASCESSLLHGTKSG
jgi:hypothetical protein